MDPSVDFVPILGLDMSFKILLSLGDPCDIARASCVSRSWHGFVVSNGLSKQLCLGMFPQLSGVDHVTESCSFKTEAETGSSNTKEWDVLEREHRVYGFLSHCCRSIVDRECISDAISASSTDNFPEEGINNTLEMRDRVGRIASYWSSEGQKKPAVPETLIYKLVGDLCVITEIDIQPFQAYFQTGLPIYSAKSVRFRMGYPKASVDLDSVDQSCHDSTNDKFVWTYTSPEFPMAQENCLQKFKFPKPVLCIGGFLLVELLGRVQRQEMDGLFYICVSHVRVLGRPLSPTFGVDIIEPSGKFVLKALSYTKESLPESSPRRISSLELQRRVRNLEHILNMLRGNVRDVEDIWDEGQDDSDEEFA
ncbi:F-box protein At4g00755 [Syzygium oleosum]|uniref:F-box protein At4g00755 n=1 Tax=Syzygium oleosum TaxID=219896 RepID=UPI0024BA6B34|nr:F-box protein At4g00755 [Syzygium oleosum]XP_056174266.1 F-box protein At4g00755 [Syzygium oleosum]